MSLEISVVREPGKSVIQLVGRLDNDSAPALQHVLIPEFDLAPHVELDFEQVGYVSSSGLRVMLLGAKTAKAKDREFTVVRVGPEVQSILKITGFLYLLKVL